MYLKYLFMLAILSFYLNVFWGLIKSFARFYNPPSPHDLPKFCVSFFDCEKRFSVYCCFMGAFASNFLYIVLQPSV
jgi:hypothetical protein